MRNWLSKWANRLLLFWVILTVLILINNSQFYINDYLAHPQHGHVDSWDFGGLLEEIENNNKHLQYYTFFILDAFWAMSLILIIGNMIKGLREDLLFHFKKRRFTLLSAYILFTICGYTFDIVEGWKYMFNNPIHLNQVVQFKTVFYALALLCLVYWVLKKFIIPNMRDILRFIETSFLSLLFIGLIYGLVMLMPQGGTLVVEMFYSGTNIVVFFALLTFLAIILSHFPVYVDIWRYGNNKWVRLAMPENRYRILGFDIIYYHPVGGKNDDNNYNRPLVKKFRRSLGILLYVAIFSIFLGVAARFFEIRINAAGLSLLILVITLIIYNSYGKRYNRWRDHLSSDNDSEKKKAVIQIVAYVKRFPLYFGLSTLLVIILAALAEYIEWNRYLLLLFLVTLGFQMYLYVYFKICRTYFKYVFYTLEHYEKREELFDKQTLKLFKDYATENHEKRKHRFQRFIATLSDNIEYLKLMRFAGIISLITLVLANFIYDVSSLLNPINIILLYIVFFYSVIIIVFKHVLYYHRADNNINLKAQKFFKFGIPSLTIIIFFVASYLAGLPNDLHALEEVEMKESLINYDEYLDGMTAEWKDQKQNYFFVGSYGGGLKANLWNLLLLHELEQKSNEKFLSRTMVLSGVSGGAVGIGNYTSLLRNYKDATQIPIQIDKIGKSNVLSNELTYLLGKDWAREYMPFFDHNGQDRSYKSMAVHAEYTGMGYDYNKKGFSDYWNTIYRDRKGRFPALLMNTTSVGGQQGVASTVRFPDGTFPGAELINLYKCYRPAIDPHFEAVNAFNCTSDSTLTHYHKKTLTYFGAVSTTNRFPFFSPTAKIEGKGSYLDGGYFENSGMLSAVEVYDAVAGDDCKNYFNKINPVFINIINSEDYYIRQKLDEWEFYQNRPQDEGEIGAIIGTLSSIDKLPRYVSEKIIARGFVLENIMMPHKITYEKVVTILNSEVHDPLRLMREIERHNDTIDSVLKKYKPYKYKEWGVVQPPLARLLSEPAVEYQKAMIKYHPDVKNTINRIKKYLKFNKEVRIKDKDSLLQILYHLETKSILDQQEKQLEAEEAELDSLLLK